MIARLTAILVLLAPSLAFAAQVTLTWQDNSNNETGFNIKRKAESCAGLSPFSNIATVPTNTVTFMDNSVVEGQVYCYEVTAFNPGNESAPSNTAEVAVGFSVPSSPSNLQGKQSQ